LEFAATEYGRKGRVVASDDVKAAIQRIGINKCAAQADLIERTLFESSFVVIAVKRNSYNEFVRWLQTQKALG